MDTATKKCPNCKAAIEVTLITTAEAGKLAGAPLKSQSILHHIKTGKLPAIRPGKEWLVQPEDLQFIADRKFGNPRNKKPKNP